MLNSPHAGLCLIVLNSLESRPLIDYAKQSTCRPLLECAITVRNQAFVGFVNTRNKLLTQKLLKQGYGYHKLRKTFSKFYRRYYDLISRFQVGLKSLLRQGLSEPYFYGDLVYKLKKIVGSNNLSVQFIKIISHYKKIGYNINVLQQTACLVVNPITVGNFAFLFKCTPVGRTSDSMMVPT